ncbi:MAG: TetR/AcrR family transcriptional regulator [Bacteroidales bacterium]|nr:TetR/AcrR family transcriptional regulator [Bacteroidales bacterium]
MSDTKDYIIDQAYKLFLSKSYEAVSISDISSAIGLTKGALYHHFINKEDLFKAVIDKYMRVIGLIDISEDFTLVRFIENDINHIKKIVQTISIDDNAFIPVNYISFLIDALRHYPGFAEEYQLFFDDVIGKLRLILSNAIKNGEVRSDIDIDLVAMNIFSTTVGITANFFRNLTPEQAIESFQKQMLEYYKILKK